MQTKYLRILVPTGALVLLFAATGRADVLSTSFKDLGSTYTLSYNSTPEATGTGVNVYDVTLSINTTGYTGTATDYINSVAIKLASGVGDVGTGTTNSALDSAPAAGNWSLETGGLSAKGCDGSGDGFLCAKDGTSAVANGTTYQWVFDYAATSALSTTAFTVKADYMTTAGKNDGITSVDVTPPTPVTGHQGTVPDGGVTVMLLGGTLVVLEGLRRRVRA